MTLIGPEYEETNPVYVQNAFDAYTGDTALEAVAKDNDGEYVTPGLGVVKVPRERWLRAQDYERNMWMVRGAGALDDGNERHAKYFNHYRDLPENVGSIVEFGAGPFTNVYHILEHHQASYITLVDPLLSTYFKHPHCTYKDGFLRGRSIKGYSVPVEEWQPPEQYDTAVMVNTLFHVMDAQAVLDKLYDCLKPGGLVVFREWPRQVDHTRQFDVGHPISVTPEFLYSFHARFERIYWTNEWYLIGRKP